MQRKIYKAVLLIVLSIALLWSSEYIICHTLKNYKKDTFGKINGVVRHDLDYEFTIWGASTARNNFKPQLLIDSLQLTGLNMGIDGANIDQYAGLLQEYLNYTQKSRYLIIAFDIHGGLRTREAFYQIHYWVQNLDNSNIYQNFHSIDSSTMNKFRYIPFYSLLKYNKHNLRPFYESLQSTTKESYVISQHGFHSRGHNDLTKKGSIQRADTTFAVPIGDRPLNKVKQAITQANKKGIQCLLVITPCFKNGLEQMTNKGDFRNALQQLTNAKTKLLDFSDTRLSENPTYFIDNTHLSDRGAEALTKLLLKEIRTLEQ